MADLPHLLPSQPKDWHPIDSIYDLGLERWYEPLREHTMETVFIPLSIAQAEVLVECGGSHLRRGGRFLPEDGARVSEDAKLLRIEVEALLDEAISPMGKAFVKLNTRSPKDAVYDADLLSTRARVEEEVSRISYCGYVRGLSKREGEVVNKLYHNAEVIAFFRAANSAMAVSSGGDAVELLIASERIQEDLKRGLELHNMRHASEGGEYGEEHEFVPGAEELARRANEARESSGDDRRVDGNAETFETEATPNCQPEYEDEAEFHEGECDAEFENVETVLCMECGIHRPEAEFEKAQRRKASHLQRCLHCTRLPTSLPASPYTMSRDEASPYMSFAEEGEAQWEEQGSEGLHPTRDGFMAQLVVRKWYDIALEDEFRAFVHNGVLTGISQYYHFCYFPTLLKQREEIQAELLAYFDAVKPRIPFESYVIDFAYVSTSPGDGEVAHENDRSSNGRRLMILELNPFNEHTGACNFSWKKGEAERKQLMKGPLEFRLTEGPWDDAKTRYLTTYWENCIDGLRERRLNAEILSASTPLRENCCTLW